MLREIPPGFLLSFLLASSLGFMGHGLFGRYRVAVLYYWLAALIGYAAGYLASLVLVTGLPRVGEAPVIEGTLGAVASVLVVRVLDP